MANRSLFRAIVGLSPAHGVIQKHPRKMGLCIIEAFGIKENTARHTLELLDEDQGQIPLYTGCISASGLLFFLSLTWLHHLK